MRDDETFLPFAVQPSDVRPADPFRGDVNFLKLSYSGTLNWLQKNKPSVDSSERIILRALFDRCIVRVLEMLRTFHPSQVAVSPSAQFKEQQRLAKEVNGIQYWIHPQYGKPLTNEQLERYALALDLCGVPLLNAYAAVKRTQKKQRGKTIDIPRSVVIRAAEVQLQNSGLSWHKIAHRLGIGGSRSGSLRKSVEKLRKFCDANAIDIPKAKRKNPK